ncbi:FAD binding domain-containing protein [Tepidamorphus sp. 3E244]|uniref:FAD binding domain-containing protein n=1 Tax=Tepidamorphus sp. 3E244 TaxID=3385498 RepID=UPI0038FC9FD7
MKPVAFDYVCPESIEEALGLLSEYGSDAVVMAGGMSLGPMLNLRLVKPSVVIDIGRIEALRAIDAGTDTATTGATVRQSDALIDETLTGHVPLLGLALPWVGHVQTRNRGTLGGSVAHADPSAETPLSLVTLGGRVQLRSRRGSRKVAADEFFLGMLTTARSPEEMITGLEWPCAKPGDHVAFAEIAERHGDFAVAAVASRVRIEGGKVSEVSIGVGGVEDRPVRFRPDAAGEVPSDELATALAEDVASKLEPISDHSASAGQRRALARTLVRRTLTTAFSQTTEAAA